MNTVSSEPFPPAPSPTWLPLSFRNRCVLCYKIELLKNEHANRQKLDKTSRRGFQLWLVHDTLKHPINVLSLVVCTGSALLCWLQREAAGSPVCYPDMTEISAFNSLSAMTCNSSCPFGHDSILSLDRYMHN